MKQTATLGKLMDFFGLNIGGIIWDNARTQLDKISNKDKVVFWTF